MALFSSVQPSLRARVLPRFPARVIAGAGITITKANGIYTFATDLSNIPLSAFGNVASGVVLGRDAVGVGPLQALTVAGGLAVTGAGGVQLSDNQRIRTLNAQLTNAGAALTTGIKMDMRVAFACIITKITLLADQSGSVVIDIWKDTFANFPPTVADTITDSAKPTLTAALKSETLPTGWITAIAAGDILRFNVDSVATITRLLIGIDVVTV